MVDWEINGRRSSRFAAFLLFFHSSLGCQDIYRRSKNKTTALIIVWFFLTPLTINGVAIIIVKQEIIVFLFNFFCEWCL